MFKQALANAKLLGLALLFCFLFSMLLNGFLGFCLYSVPKKLIVYIPPHIPESGLSLKGNQTSNSQVYSFAYYVWQSIQTWPVNGSDDYKKNLDRFAPYITPDFKNVLEKEGKDLYSQGFLYGHQQAMFGASDNVYKPENVKYMGHGEWLVHLVMRTVNRVAPIDQSKAFVASHVVRDAETSYVFKVIKTNYAPDKNHWHLVIAGYGVPPEVRKIYK
jgi:integrating conjugative element protein (TIGR03746 family)